MGKDRDGDSIFFLVPPGSKTDQFDDGDIKAPKSLNNAMRPVRVVSKWLLMSKSNNPDDGRVFRPHLRKSVTFSHRAAGASGGVEGICFGSHSLPAGSLRHIDLWRRNFRRKSVW